MGQMVKPEMEQGPDHKSLYKPLYELCLWKVTEEFSTRVTSTYLHFKVDHSTCHVKYNGARVKEEGHLRGCGSPAEGKWSLEPEGQL